MTDSSTLCDLCNSLFKNLNFSFLENDEVLVSYQLEDILPTCPRLAASAWSGCGFCAILLERVTSKFATRNKTCALYIGPAKFIAESALISGLSDQENGFYLLELILTAGSTQSVPLRFELYSAEGKLHATAGGTVLHARH